MTSPGSRSGDRSDQNTPAAKDGIRSEATSSASLVLSEPPGPVSVTRRVPFWSMATSSSRSLSLPTSDEAGRGKFVLEIVRSGGKSPSPS